MEYLAIRDDANKNVYYYKTKGEKGRILSKFPNASNRVFAEEDCAAALEWAGVERIATPEENLWATTKIKKTTSKDEIVEEKTSNEEKIPVEEKDTSTKKVEKEIKPEKEQVKDLPKEDAIDDNVPDVIKTENGNVQNDDKQVKHVMSDFEQIIELYKKSGVKSIDVHLKNGKILHIVVDDLYYIETLYNKDDFEYPLSAYTEAALRDDILKKVEERKQNGEKGAIFNNHIDFSMFGKIAKTKYLAFGDLVYIANGNNIKYDIKDKDTTKYYVGDDDANKNITFSTTNISMIVPSDLSNYYHLVREKEFTTYIKRTLKSLEKKKEKEKSET